MAATLDARIRLDSSQYTGGLNRILRETNSAVGKISQQFGTLQNVLTGGVFGGAALSLFGAGTTAAAEMESLTRMLGLVSGGAEAGAAKLAELAETAKRPGLDLESAAQATIRLRTMGFTAEETNKHIVSLSNKVAAFGGGGEEMKGVILALSQISSKGKVSAEEINQLAERIPTIRNDMKDLFGTGNTEELQKMGLAADAFIDGILTKWSEAPDVIGGTKEAVKNLGVEWKLFLSSVVGTTGGELASGLAGFLNGLRTEVQEARLTLAWLANGEQGGSSYERQVEAQKFLADMQEKLKASNDAKAKALKEKSDAEAAEAKAKSDAWTSGRDRMFANFVSTSEFEASSANLEADAIKQWNDAREKLSDLFTNVDFNAESDKLKQAADAARDAAQMGVFDAIGMNEENARGLRDAMVEDVKRGPRRTSERRRAERQDELARIKAADELTRKQLKEERADRRKNAFNDLKENKKFVDEAERAKELKKTNRDTFKTDAKKTVDKLIDIHAVLLQLAKA